MRPLNTIPGIYNYCDRWCERCPLTERCAIYEPHDAESSSSATERPSFWKDLSNKPEGTIEVLQKFAVYLRVGLNSRHNEWPLEIQENLPATRLTEHPLASLSNLYTSLVHKWFSEINLESYVRELRFNSAHPREEDAATLSDCAEVILRYAAFIPLKLDRAICSSINRDKWAEDNGLQRDSDGSAKIALIGIHRSIHAWSIFYTYFPEHEDHILHALASLQRIENLTLTAFPHAMAFVRPGFDEKIVCK